MPYRVPMHSVLVECDTTQEVMGLLMMLATIDIVRLAEKVDSKMKTPDTLPAVAVPVEVDAGAPSPVGKGPSKSKPSPVAKFGPATVEQLRAEQEKLRDLLLVAKKKGDIKEIEHRLNQIASELALLHPVDLSTPVVPAKPTKVGVKAERPKAAKKAVDKKTASANPAPAGVSNTLQDILRELKNPSHGKILQDIHNVNGQKIALGDLITRRKLPPRAAGGFVQAVRAVERRLGLKKGSALTVELHKGESAMVSTPL